MRINELDRMKAVEGRLSIEKYFPDGHTEKVFEKDNLIVLESRQSILSSLYSTPISISSIVCVAQLVTVVTSVNHGLESGNVVIIYGVAPSTYTGTFQISVVSPNTFTYNALTVITTPGAGPSMELFPVPTPDPINFLNIGIGGGIDSRSISACSINSATTTLTTTTGGFLFSDVGQSLTIPGAGPGGDPLNVLVMSYTSPNSVVISSSAATTVSGVKVAIGQGLFPKQEDPLQTALVSQVASLPIIYTVDLSVPSITFIADATQSMANGMLLTEAGLFKLSGKIFNVKNHTGIPKTSDFGVHYVWTIKYA